MYQYTLPDGQVVSFPQTPPNFDGATASAAEAAAYGVPPAPAPTSPSYSAWQAEASTWQLHPGGSPYILTTDATNTLDSVAAPASPLVTYPSGPFWAGYIDNGSGSGWTQAQAQYDEPGLGYTNPVCQNPAVSFWAGIGGYGNGQLGQDGTESGILGWPNHVAWFEVLPGNAVEFTTNGSSPVIANPGNKVTATTTYLGGGTYRFTIYVAGTPYLATEGGGYSGTTTEEIVERPQTGGNGQHSPLLNFNSITMWGYNGRDESPIADFAYTQANMGGFASTGALSGAEFSVKQENCQG